MSIESDTIQIGGGPIQSNTWQPYEPVQYPTYTYQYPSYDTSGEAQVIRPGDVIVVRSERRVPKDVADRVKERFNEVFPGHKVLILEAGLDFEVVRPTT